MDLDAYRHSAETLISELTGAYYRHYAGLAAEYEIEPIYARHAGLFTCDAVARFGDRVRSAELAGERPTHRAKTQPERTRLIGPGMS